MLSLPKGFIEKSRKDYSCGQIIVRGIYETDEGVDEKCIIIYIGSRIDYIYLLGEELCLVK